MYVYANFLVRVKGICLKTTFYEFDLIVCPSPILLLYDKCKITQHTSKI